jgi:hypothetical protein
MANVKISELPVASAANQDQVIPIVDGADTKQISVDSVLNIASGVKAGFDTVDGSYIQCEDAGNVISVSGHYIPANNAQYDLGSAESKIRHLYLSDSSIYMGNDPLSDGNKISVANDELVFTNVDGVTESKPCLMPTVTPVTHTSPGKVGQMAVDATHLYICVGQDTWKRILIDSLGGLETSWGV